MSNCAAKSCRYNYQVYNDENCASRIDTSFTVFLIYEDRLSVRAYGIFLGHVVIAGVRQCHAV